MTIYLVRHTEYSNPDNIFPFRLPVELSEKGLEHAKRIGVWFKDRNLVPPIFSSPIRRALQTSEIISQITGSTVVTEEKIIETFSKDMQGVKQPTSGESIWEFEMKDNSREPIQMVQDRVVSFFNEVVNKGKDSIIVSHGDPLTALYYYMIKKPLVPCLFDDEHMDMYIKRGEIVKVEVSNKIKIERITV